MNPVHEKILKLLDDQGVKYETQSHEAVTTSADAARVRGVSMHAGAKALVLQGRKTGKHWLAVMPADLRLADKKFEALVGEKISFAKAPEDVTGCVKGSVPPFGSVLGLATYCDKRLAENETIHFNAGSLTDSVTMPYADYARIEKPAFVEITEPG
ncbi:MAG TPA: YbaK/EbsC family protein [Candidatus Binatia bacterium]|jgi:Ala-tRNA(Pro) deacylase|nr:YbaK/EbsC family protein [Candidatus Binatia bacterium]